MDDLGEMPYLPLGASGAYIHEQMVCCGNDTDFCVNYEEPGVRYSKCSRCKFVSYCSSECQKRDWARHKKTCKQLAKFPDLRSKMMKFVKNHPDKVDVIKASTAYRACQEGVSLFESEGEKPSSVWATSDDVDGPRRPTFAGCEKGVYLPVFSVIIDLEKLDQAITFGNGDTSRTQQILAASGQRSYIRGAGVAGDGLSYLYTGDVITSPSQASTADYNHHVGLDCPGLVYLKALQYDLTCMHAEGAFLIEYTINDPCGGKTNILSATRFYMPLQVNVQGGPLNINSLLRWGPKGRHSNVDPSWMGTITRVAELSYTACDTNMPGGLCGAMKNNNTKKDASAADSEDASSSSAQAQRESIRKPPVKIEDASWSERVQQFVSQEMEKKSEQFYDENKINRDQK